MSKQSEWNKQWKLNNKEKVNKDNLEYYHKHSESINNKKREKRKADRKASNDLIEELWNKPVVYY